MKAPALAVPPFSSPDEGHLRADIRPFLDRLRRDRAFYPRCDSWSAGADLAFSREFGGRRWLGVTWPYEYGGHERISSERYVVVEEMLAAGAPVAARGRHLATVEPTLGGDTRLNGPAHAHHMLITALSVAIAAVLTGISTHLLDASVEQVKKCHQFGRPIVLFQGVKHRLADAFVAVKTGRPSIWAAAHALGVNDPEADTSCVAATLIASRAHNVIHEHALQSHGGAGLARESSIHLWLILGKNFERAYGTARGRGRRLRRSILSESSPAPNPCSGFAASTTTDTSVSSPAHARST